MIYGQNEIQELIDKVQCQREKLARVEAERDALKAENAELASSIELEDASHAHRERELQEQMTEAVILIGQVQDCQSFDDVKVISRFLADFLARYAQYEQQEVQGAQTGEFQREDRYIVIKRKDLDQLPMEMRLPFSMALNELAPRLPKRQYLVIESDWPEYEPTWSAIQARVTGQGEKPEVK